MRKDNPFFSTLGTLDRDKITIWPRNHYVSFRYHYYIIITVLGLYFKFPHSYAFLHRLSLTRFTGIA